MLNNLSMRLLYYIVMAYMTLSYSWWALLLHKNTTETYSVKMDHLYAVMLNKGEVNSQTEFEKTTAYLELKNKRTSQTRMILGEGAVFLITLIIGLWLINKGYDREIKANQQRRNFLLSITHELKSPLSSIRLLLETLMKRELPKPQANELLRNAYDENERLYELVENLLLSAKLEGHYKPFFEEFSLVNLVEELIAKQKVKHPEVDFTVEVSKSFPLVNMDKPGMWSVINNLLENAIKYRNGDPKIEIRLFEQGQMVNIEVADCGPGIPVSERKRIFEKFYRIGSEETRKSKGTGLGLFIVKQIVKAHNGKILVTDNKPRGTVFSISFPA